MEKYIMLRVYYLSLIVGGSHVAVREMMHIPITVTGHTFFSLTTVERKKLRYCTLSVVH